MPRKTIVYGGPRPTLPDQLEPVAASRDLAEALALVTEHAADVLFTPRLQNVAHSLTELVRLLDWLQAAGAQLVSEDPPLDTATSEGRRMTSLLREIDRWEREPEHPRKPRGRPGLKAAAPHVAERIAKLRDDGLSLHAIADELNRQRIPTPRGGEHWRASSVQAALGYRRPRPPVPGAPPPKPHGPKKPHGPRKP
jgi:DNA invertase Pin-like site-specific DNA recombinase